MHIAQWLLAMHNIRVLAALNIRAVALRAVMVTLVFAVLVTETPDNITSRHLPGAMMEATVDTALFNLVLMATEVSGTKVTLCLKACCSFRVSRTPAVVFIIIMLKNG